MVLFCAMKERGERGFVLCDTKGRGTSGVDLCGLADRVCNFGLRSFYLPFEEETCAWVQEINDFPCARQWRCASNNGCVAPLKILCLR